MRIMHHVQTEMTLQDVANVLHISYETAYRDEKSALSKVKKYLYERFGSYVTIEDLLPYYKEEVDEYEMPKL